MEAGLYDELLIELECPICTHYMSAPIRQCSTGHSICDTCVKKLQRCALCQGKFTESRNLSLEGLATKLRYPCVNKFAGCDVKLTFSERDAHEARCPHRGYKCAMDKCNWVGRHEDLVGHWSSKKMTSKPYHKSNICHTKMKAESYYVNMVNAYNKIFWFKCKITNNKLFWAVQYIGNIKEAENYSYEIEIFKPGRIKKKIILSDYCQSIDIENQDLFKDDACISLGVDTVSGFVSGGEQILIYYLRVNEDIKVAQQNNQQLPPTSDLAKKQRDRSKGPPAYKKKQNPNKNQTRDGGFVLLN